MPKNLFVNPDAVWGNAKTYFKTGAPAIVGCVVAVFACQRPAPAVSVDAVLRYAAMLLQECRASLTCAARVAVTSTLTAFLLLRGSFERSKREWNGTFKHVAVPLTLVALPSVAYAVVKKAPPPEAAGVGLIFCLLTHSYDRMVNLQHYNGWLGKPT